MGQTHGKTHQSTPATPGRPRRSAATAAVGTGTRCWNKRHVDFPEAAATGTSDDTQILGIVWGSFWRILLDVALSGWDAWSTLRLLIWGSCWRPYQVFWRVAHPADELGCFDQSRPMSTDFVPARDRRKHRSLGSSGRSNGPTVNLALCSSVRP